MASFWARLAKFTSLRDGLAPASGGGTTNFLRADGTWASPSASANPIALSEHVVASDFVVTAGNSAYVARYVEISDGVNLEVGGDGDMEIG